MVQRVIDDAPGTDPIPVLWAWVAVDAMGGEGIVGAVMPGLGSTPLVTGRQHLAEGPMRKLVQGLPATGRRFELRRYVLAEGPPVATES